ncbi:PqqD family protein [Nocardioides sp. SOB77]|uniref:PqqD family protein n=1 Tax=Nocardioides oceani TaxID=3058369 RepID=A0ABT8FIL4_9ACTN|nr:PqqD family protein [Nocardioides oceani]MDN4174508.1 PqqD family protein [Nocardioides oceani]
MTDDRRLWRRREEDVAMVESDLRVAMLDLRRLDDPPIILEGSAAVIWQLLAEPQTIDDLLTDLAEVFDAPASEMVGGARAFLEDLERRGLVLSNEEAD